MPGAYFAASIDHPLSSASATNNGGRLLFQDIMFFQLTDAPGAGLVFNGREEPCVANGTAGSVTLQDEQQMYLTFTGNGPSPTSHYVVPSPCEITGYAVHVITPIGLAPGVSIAEACVIVGVATPTTTANPTPVNSPVVDSGYDYRFTGGIVTPDVGANVGAYSFQARENFATGTWVSGPDSYMLECAAGDIIVAGLTPGYQSNSGAGGSGTDHPNGNEIRISIKVRFK